MGRYSDIRRGEELKKAYDKMKLWEAKDREEKQAAYKVVAKTADQRSKPEKIKAFLLPFAKDDTVIYLECRALSATQNGTGAATANTARSLVDDRFKLELPTTGTVESVRIPKYEFAKIILSARTETATAKTASRITGTPYKRHRSNNISCPFGRLTATESFADATKLIKAKSAYETFKTTAGNRIGFVMERG